MPRRRKCPTCWYTWTEIDEALLFWRHHTFSPSPQNQSTLYNSKNYKTSEDCIHSKKNQMPRFPLLETLHSSCDKKSYLHILTSHILSSSSKYSKIETIDDVDVVDALSTYIVYLYLSFFLFMCLCG